MGQPDIGDDGHHAPGIPFRGQGQTAAQDDPRLHSRLAALGLLRLQPGPGSTWKSYQRDAGRYGADRDDFGDAIDFIGWYNHQSWRRSGINRADAYHLYLAYHEGHGGYNRGSYRGKAWLVQVAKKVSQRSARYRSQLLSCEEELKDDGWFFGWF